MKALSQIFHRLFIRFRYPVSLPEDISEALGIPLSNYLSFEEFVEHLISPTCRVTKLTKFMPREKAEYAFRSALRKERFKQNTLFSYYFSEGWMEFVLQFDEQSRLRRIYLQHQKIQSPLGVEIPLSNSLSPHNLINLSLTKSHSPLI